MTKHVIVLIETSGPGFVDNEEAEIARVLHDLADGFNHGTVKPGLELFDHTGAGCGEVKVILVETGP